MDRHPEAAAQSAALEGYGRGADRNRALPDFDTLLVLKSAMADLSAVALRGSALMRRAPQGDGNERGACSS